MQSKNSIRQYPPLSAKVSKPKASGNQNLPSVHQIQMRWVGQPNLTDSQVPRDERTEPVLLQQTSDGRHDTHQLTPGDEANAHPLTSWPHHRRVGPLNARVPAARILYTPRGSESEQDAAKPKLPSFRAHPTLPYPYPRARGTGDFKSRRPIPSPSPKIWPEISISPPRALPFFYRRSQLRRSI